MNSDIIEMGKEIVATMIVIALIAGGVAGCFSRPDGVPPQPTATPKPSMTRVPREIKTFHIVLVSAGGGSGHDEELEVRADFCGAKYNSEVFDGRKTPLLQVKCYIGGHWVNDSWAEGGGYYVGGRKVFEGLSDAFWEE